MLINNYRYKRISAYFIDFIIVAFIAAIFSEFAIINPYYDEYFETYEKYTEFVDNSENVNNKNFLVELENYTYDIAKYGVYFTIISCVVNFLYFTICQYYAGGKTLGKSLFKMKIVGNKNKKISFIQIIVRSFLVNSILINILNVIFIFMLNKKACLLSLSIIELFDYLFLFITLSMIIFRKDHRGLHDMICGTRVIDEKCKEIN